MTVTYELVQVNKFAAPALLVIASEEDSGYAYAEAIVILNDDGSEREHVYLRHAEQRPGGSEATVLTAINQLVDELVSLLIRAEAEADRPDRVARLPVTPADLGVHLSLGRFSKRHAANDLIQSVLLTNALGELRAARNLKLQKGSV
jgi:hypothetical protein